MKLSSIYCILFCFLVFNSCQDSDETYVENEVGTEEGVGGVEDKETEEEFDKEEENENPEVEHKPTIYCTTPYIQNSEFVQHTYHSIQYSEEDEQAYWVAYKLTPEFLSGTTERGTNFRNDPLVSTNSASTNDYTNSGYDRGHLVPAASMVYNETAMYESFYMSNVSPQNPSFNRGVWKRLETQVREWANASDSLYVVTGPVLNNITERIGDNQVSVPQQFYKVLLRFDNEQVSAIAFLMDNENSSNELLSFATSVDAIEELTGVDFNAGLDDELEAEFESGFDIGDWE